MNPRTRKKVKVNGCTMAPDLDFVECCNEHDRDYAAGGGFWSRFVADWKLMRCIQCRSKLILRYFIGFLYFLGVRLFGEFFFSFWWSWKWKQLGKNMPSKNGWYLVRWSEVDPPERVFLKLNGDKEKRPFERWIFSTDGPESSNFVSVCKPYEDDDVKFSPFDILWKKG